ncbi:hypothetical protein MiSe_05040 [Microseira wollei NIES-4236]|uniref:Glycosyltransferase RgtA/B/C/D-like domain-containing protein n=2 Tax=Microseira wollei TaxID=467598 RepID=A0AAV3X5Z8_9CYAN|nr:hypothetical protein MiSe_05040 [Microseira wollei NIES-4236]
MRLTRLDILVLATVVLIGLIHVPYPFEGDQALFTIGAWKMSQGGILYRDFWDLKQPGIYAFYLLAGSMFGFHEVGIHSFELLYMLAFSAVLIITLKDYYSQRAIASLTPLLTVGIYYGVSGAWHLTQLEALVGFPMFLALYFAVKAYLAQKYQFGLLFLSGVMGGIVLLFKLIFLPILLVFWAMALIDAVGVKGFFKRLIAIGVTVVLGTLLPLAIAGIYFAQFDLLPLLYQNFFERPIQIFNQSPFSTNERFIKSVMWFISRLAPLIVFGSIGAYTFKRQPRDLMTLYLVLWLISGLGVILIQYKLGWEYYFMLIVVPLGILAGKGLEFLWQIIRQNPGLNLPCKKRSVAAFSLIFLFSTALISLARKSFFLVLEGFAIKQDQQRGYQSHLAPDYPTILKEVAWLKKPERLPGDIYVFGDPRYYLLSGRKRAIAFHLWTPLVPDQWMQLREQLQAERPVYIFVETRFSLLLQKQPQIARFIASNYNISHQSNAGVWYILNRK